MLSWKHTGRERPSFAEEPGPGQESVWDYPRPPSVRADSRHVVVRYGDIVVADTTAALRVLETASPPTFYLPEADVATDLLVPNRDHGSYCEWKGAATYFDLLLADGRVPQVAWRYADPSAPFAALVDHFSFYPGKVECYIDGERVRPQPGGFYGGWMTSDIVGPVKGEPGTGGW